MTIIGSLECNLSARTLREGTTHYDSMCNALILCLSPYNDTFQIICSIKRIQRLYELKLNTSEISLMETQPNHLFDLIPQE